MGSGRERQYAQWQQRWLAAWLLTKERRLLHAAFCGATRPFSILAVSSIDIIAINGRHMIPKWQWRRCKIVQKWPCGAEWRPLGSSARIFCVTTWMPNAVFRCWRLHVAYRIWLGKHRWTYFHARWYVPGWIRSFRDDGLGRRGPHEWPAGSPHLTPCDFFLWGWAKEEVYWAKPRTMEQLEDRIRNVITSVPHDSLQKTVDSIPSSLRKLVDAAGAYIEF